MDNENGNGTTIRFETGNQEFTSSGLETKSTLL